MKTLIRLILIAALSYALTSCSDNGPVSADQKDALISGSVSTLNVEHNGYDVPLNSSHVGAVNSEFQVDTCPAPPEGQEDWYGWHFIMPGNNNFTALTVTFQDAGTFTADPFPGDVFIAHPDESHAYIWTETDDVLLSGSAMSDGSNSFFNLSHTCPGENGNGGGESQSLLVTKTVETSYIRTHDWSIDKVVDTDNGYELEETPKIWLFIDGSGNESAEWAVDVTYEGYEDSDWNVSGVITITNIGANAKLIDSVVDELAGEEIPVECSVNDADISFPYTLAVAGVITCTYSEDIYVEGNNVVTVTVDAAENDLFSPYSDTKAIVWGDPDTEVNALVTVSDLSELFGSKTLGTLDAADYDEGDIIPFNYNKSFAWGDYGTENCGGFTYGNTAEVIGDDDMVLDSDDASLKVNVQCYVYESAWAKGDPAEAFCDNGFNNWGWSNPVEPGAAGYEMQLWAGAGRCDTSKGTLVGKVVIDYNGGFNAEYVLDSPFILTEQHVYAGSTMFPQQRRGRGWADTTAPGQYYISSPLEGNIFVIAHGVVGLPDPNFGPE